jgi:N-acetylglucosaminyl-diphospho-decaprenol L-rhamnosyltransferase
MLGIAIVNYRTASDTDALVRGIVARRHDEQVTIAIVDNGDEAPALLGTVAFARESGLGCHLIHGHGNVGYAAGNNLAGAALLDAGASVIWVLNPDARVIAGSLAALVGVTGIASTHNGTGAISLWTGRSNRKGLTYVAGHSLVIGRAAWQKLGGLSERYFLYFEEADLAERSGRLGIPTTAIGDVVVTHAGGTATDLRAKAPTAYFHASRSCMIFFRRHHPGRLPVVIVARLGYAARVFGAGGAGRSGRATAVLKGLLAGLRA